MALREDQVRRYARHVLLPEVGGVGQRRLLEARVGAADLGGANAVAVMYLAAAGVGTIAATDRAPVTAEDVAVGALYEAADVGRPRIEAAAERVAALNPDTRVVDSGAAEWTLAPSGPADAIEAMEVGALAAVRLIQSIAAGGRA